MTSKRCPVYVDQKQQQKEEDIVISHFWCWQQAIESFASQIGLGTKCRSKTNMGKSCETFQRINK